MGTPNGAFQVVFPSRAGAVGPPEDTAGS